MTVLRNEVFAKIPDQCLRIYAVWQPVLASDSLDKLPEATALLGQDPRAVQYWDPRGEIGRRFAKALDLPLTTPAWDVYLLYPPQTRWRPGVPLPTFWMHQLGFPLWSDAAKRFGNMRLDGVRFREQVQRLLGAVASHLAPLNLGYFRSREIFVGVRG